ncbi:MULTISPECIES: hypothetical protein [Halorubrum]|uniref:Histidine kinase n=1 Tax=Halorubrum tropicale TaxID=1765655 RepID=A0A0M9ATY7_9EURY|nr:MULTISPECIES: hypothetical protein [Halorubrum]KOX98248.1 hypothetical protein AMR74_04980 [Halorubrum tropicale]TKX45377.1 hypothetical protein EXE50_05315 [Halorubrum sp. ARQ200]TKX51450.1 hypothetical protein EXE49_00730 [Halorubrum sp. ASP121]TKX61369.1 hypothetical protein EXE48_10095 [Halorubrum sp. ASP1]
MSRTGLRDGTGPDGTGRRWRAGASSGLVAGAAMGAVLHAGLGLMPTIGALVGVETVVGGWAVHLFNSTLFGALFVAVFDRSFFADLRGDVGGCLSLGVIHSALLGVITGGLLLPAAIAIEGATSLPVPTLPVPGLTASFEFGVVIAVAHLVYGVVLGRAFAAFTLAEGAIDWLPTDPANR